MAELQPLILVATAPHSQELEVVEDPLAAHLVEAAEVALSI
jgi:hypothetical protein